MVQTAYWHIQYSNSSLCTDTVELTTTDGGTDCTIPGRLDDRWLVAYSTTMLLPQHYYRSVIVVEKKTGGIYERLKVMQG